MTIDKHQTKSIILKILVEISRIVLGVTFIFSGFVKMVDPWGFAFKIEDYLSAFNLTSLSFLSFPASSFLCILEFVMGAFLLFGLYRFWTSRLILLFMIFMTPLTLYLAIANPVEDCGCFGDALIISNWETFFKNIVLTVFAIIVFFNYQKISNFFTGKTYWIAFLFIIIFSIGFVISNYIYEPAFDFRPYHIGASIPEQMVVEEGKERIEESLLVYEKDGVEKEFTDENFPWEDSTWVFVRMDTKIIKEGAEPKVTDFTLTRLTLDNSKKNIISQDEITDQVLSDSNYTFLMISPTLSRVNIDYLSSLEDVAYYAKEHEYNFYCLTASVTDEILEFIEKHSVNFDFCTVDERTLKTISRTNPGLLLIKNGTIVNKWADIEVPAEQDLKEDLETLGLNNPQSVQEQDRQRLFYIIFIFFLPLVLLKLFDFSVYRKKKKEEKKTNE